MSTNHQALVEKFELHSTEHLLERLETGGMTDEAVVAMEQVLAARGVPAQARAEVQANIREAARLNDQAASLLARFVANTLDILIAVALMACGTAMSSQSWQAPALVGFLGMFVYLMFADGLPNGQSLGKRVVGIAVVDANTRQPCTWLKSLARNIAGVLGILDWVFIFGRKRQRLGDVLARTAVINFPPATHAGRVEAETAKTL